MFFSIYPRSVRFSQGFRNTAARPDARLPGRQYSSLMTRLFPKFETLMNPHLWTMVMGL